ncbi:hypothetical protein FRC16_008769 [Serendipita sp. 398]|nr:hypothetical protein FRC16_008769 [Serendipita sp. 398]
MGRIRFATGQTTESNKEERTDTRTVWKRVDEIFDEENQKWILRDTAPYTAVEGEDEQKDEYTDCCFLLKKHYGFKSPSNTIYIVIKSDILKDTLVAAIGDSCVISKYNSSPELNPTTLLDYYFILLSYLKSLDDSTPEGSDETAIVQLDVLLGFLRTEYREHFTKVAAILQNSEVSFDILRAILIPRTEFYITDSRTGQPRVVVLKRAALQSDGRTSWYDLQCEYVETFGSSDSDKGRKDGCERAFGRASYNSTIQEFNGTVKINALSAYPLQYHPRKEDVKQMLITRGKKWADYNGMHHVAYTGIAYQSYRKIYVKGRSVIDKATFQRVNPNWGVPLPKSAHRNQYDDWGYESTGTEAEPTVMNREGLTDADYMLAPPIVYGFALEDKEWVELNIDLVKPIVWNDEAFANLVLPEDKKMLIKALVEVHSTKGRVVFDDFIVGKGQGLVINLFGPPGVGKTMSAEATSEHLRRPLYIVGAGDLGTSASSLDTSLTQIFDIGHSWNAVILIDEADVFLEERSVHDIHRNALVAVFLRQLEYFAGILFLTTNRVGTFDQAFASRIHIALKFKELDELTKHAIWKAFLTKVEAVDNLTADELSLLVARKINGRQIKNAVKTAQALALNQRKSLGFAHLNQVLSVMEQFESDLKKSG